MGVNKNRAHIIHELYKDVVLIATLKGKDRVLLLLLDDAKHNGERAIQKIVQSFEYYYKKDIPLSNVEYVEGGIGLWMPTKMVQEGNEAVTTPEFQHLEAQALMGKIAYVQQAISHENLTKRLEEAYDRINAGVRGLN